MGKIVLREIRHVEKVLKLSEDDYEKRRKRTALRDEIELRAKPTRHELRFAEKLEKCPFCGKTPRYMKICSIKRGTNSYKMTCDIHNQEPQAIYFLDCGGWFATPSKAGRDWNERVRKARMDRLTRQQLRTLKGQIFAGDADGAMRGLERILAHAHRSSRKGEK